MIEQADDKYRWRQDGNYMVRVKCESCGDMFDCHAMCNALSEAARFCDACYTVRKWMER